jgi:hypothetical protein
VRRTFAVLAVLLCVGLALAASSSGRKRADVRWASFVRAPGVVDLAGPRADGRFVVATLKGLFLLRRSGSLAPFARGQDGYVAPQGEPYIALGTGRGVPNAGCTFRRDEIYALEPTTNPGVTAIAPNGRARRFFNLPARSFASAIALDTVGRFGHRLLVAAIASNRTTLYALDCRGRSRVLVRGAPKVEGGAAVAPKGFGRLAGRLIAVDELSGRIFAFGPKGGVLRVATPNVPAGSDLGVESLGFVPPGFTRKGVAYLADLGAPGSPTVGTDSVLRLSGGALLNAGVRPDDLLVTTEASGITLTLRCSRRCTTRKIGRALDATHAEGHIAFGR